MGGDRAECLDEDAAVDKLVGNCDLLSIRIGNKRRANVSNGQPDRVTTRLRSPSLPPSTRS